VPLTEKTKWLISLKEFSSMKDSCIFINTSRWDVVVEEDLLFALKNNVIAWAGIDVYHDEPPSNIELLSLQNLLCTPHIWWASQESILGLGTASIDMLLSFFNNNNQ
jgi:D-3-phosphoglycerate dehydrogenase